MKFLIRGIERPLTLLLEKDVPAYMIDEIFFQLLAGGRLMRTWKGRFAELDRLMIAEIDAMLPADKVPRVHDLGASNGITSLEFFRALSEHRMATLRASDYYDAAFAWRVGGIAIIADAYGEPLQIAYGSTAISMRRGLWRHFLKPLWLLMHCRRSTVERISLFHPEAIRVANTNPAFELARDDAYNLSPERFDVVRALNLFKGMPSRADRQRMLASIARSVKGGGLLIIGDGDNCSALVKNGARFEERRRIGSGFKYIDEMPSASASMFDVPTSGGKRFADAAPEPPE